MLKRFIAGLTSGKSAASLYILRGVSAFIPKLQDAVNLLTLLIEGFQVVTSHIGRTQNMNEREQMVLGSIGDENYDITAAGSDLVPPAPWPNCPTLNMEQSDVDEMFVV